MGRKFRSKIAAGKDKQELKVLQARLDWLRKYAEHTHANTMVAFRAIVEYLNANTEIAAIYERLQTEARGETTSVTPATELQPEAAKSETD